jgi:hypothetical protein
VPHVAANVGRVLKSIEPRYSTMPRPTDVTAVLTRKPSLLSL